MIDLLENNIRIAIESYVAYLATQHEGEYQPKKYFQKADEIGDITLDKIVEIFK